MVDKNETSLDFTGKARVKDHKKVGGALSFANHSALKEKCEMFLRKSFCKSVHEKTRQA